jgi:hypothetical protein
MGIGATIRHALLRTSGGTLTGRMTPVPSTALEMAARELGLDWLELSGADDAQQSSACA